MRTAQRIAKETAADVLDSLRNGTASPETRRAWLLGLIAAASEPLNGPEPAREARHESQREMFAPPAGTQAELF